MKKQLLNRTKKQLIYCLSCLMLTMMLSFLSSENQLVPAKTVKVTVKASKISENSKVYDASDIQKYLDKAIGSKKTYVVKVPKGTYVLGTTGLHIYSNTTLVLTGVTIKRGSKMGQGAMIQVGYPRKEKGKSTSTGGGYTKGGYTRGANIKIIGGTFDAGKSTKKVTTLCTFSHVKNITFQGTTFRYLPNKTTNKHMIELGGSKNVKLDHCKFIGNRNCGEAVQIESTRKGVASSDLMGKEDGTPTKNVTVTKCTFSGFEYGIGTNHGTSKDSYTGIVIKNNIFSGISKYAICTYNYKKCKILNNKVVKSGKRTFDSFILKLGQKDTYVKKGNKVK